jgi:hypothetical protein
MYIQEALNRNVTVVTRSLKRGGRSGPYRFFTVKEWSGPSKCDFGASCNWVSKVGQVTGRYRARWRRRAARARAFSDGRAPDPLVRERGSASTRLLCNDVNCKYLPEGPPRPGAARRGAARRGRDCARVGTESRPKEVKAARRAKRRKSRRAGPAGGAVRGSPGVFKNTPKWSTPLQAPGNKRDRERERKREGENRPGVTVRAVRDHVQNRSLF